MNDEMKEALESVYNAGLGGIARVGLSTRGHRGAEAIETLKVAYGKALERLASTEDTGGEDEPTSDEDDDEFAIWTRYRLKPSNFRDPEVEEEIARKDFDAAVKWGRDTAHREEAKK